MNLTKPVPNSSRAQKLYILYYIYSVLYFVIIPKCIHLINFLFKKISFSSKPKIPGFYYFKWKIILSIKTDVIWYYLLTKSLCSFRLQSFKDKFRFCHFFFLTLFFVACPVYFKLLLSPLDPLLRYLYF